MQEALGMTLTPVEIVETPRPEIKAEELSDGYGKFSIGPLERGYGVTLGNPLRRVLLSSIPGTAVTWVKIEGVTHEYSTIPHVKEEVTDLLLSFKAIRLRALTDRPGKLRLEVSGEGEVTAGDLMAPGDFEVANPELHLATLDSPEAKLSVEFNVEQGTGFVPAVGDDGFPIGVIPVDAIFTPVRRVNYSVERTRVGQVTDYERLIVEVWTDETISPMDALSKAGQILVDSFFLFANIKKAAESAGEAATLAVAVPAEVYNTPVERLELSARTLNCLKRAHINRVGEILEKDRSELLKIRNFGEKSLDELYARLDERGFLPEQAESQDGELAEESDATLSTEDVEDNAPADEALEVSE